MWRFFSCKEQKLIHTCSSQGGVCWKDTVGNFIGIRHPRVDKEWSRARSHARGLWCVPPSPFLLEQGGQLLCFAGKLPLQPSLLTYDFFAPASTPTPSFQLWLTLTPLAHTLPDLVVQVLLVFWLRFPGFPFQVPGKGYQIGPARSGVCHYLVSCGGNVAGLMGCYEFHKADPLKDWLGHILY